MIRSAKYLLQPTKGQGRRLDHLLWQQRMLYNAALGERKTAWEREQRSVTRYQQFAPPQRHGARRTRIWPTTASAWPGAP